MFVRHDLADTVPTPSGNMHFIKKGTGYPVVLLHPAGTSVWVWETVLETLSQSFTYYAFDMMGHGDSDKPNRQFNIPDYARALDQACQILNIHRTHVVGNSVGAVLAIETTASFPERQNLLHNNIINSERVILPGLGHVPQVEDPEAFWEPLLPSLKT